MTRVIRRSHPSRIAARPLADSGAGTSAGRPDGTFAWPDRTFAVSSAGSRAVLGLVLLTASCGDPTPRDPHRSNIECNTASPSHPGQLEPFGPFVEGDAVVSQVAVDAWYRVAGGDRMEPVGVEPWWYAYPPLTDFLRNELESWFPSAVEACQAFRVFTLSEDCAQAGGVAFVTHARAACPWEGGRLGITRFDFEVPPNRFDAYALEDLEERGVGSPAEPLVRLQIEVQGHATGLETVRLLRGEGGPEIAAWGADDLVQDRPGWWRAVPREEPSPLEAGVTVRDVELAFFLDDRQQVRRASLRGEMPIEEAWRFVGMARPFDRTDALRIWEHARPCDGDDACVPLWWVPDVMSVLNTRL